MTIEGNISDNSVLVLWVSKNNTHLIFHNSFKHGDRSRPSAGLRGPGRRYFGTPQIPIEIINHNIAKGGLNLVILDYVVHFLGRLVAAIPLEMDKFLAKLISIKISCVKFGQSIS
jgi:hypothetical protein